MANQQDTRVLRLSPRALPETMRALLASPGGNLPDPAFVSAFARNLEIAGIRWRAWEAIVNSSPARVVALILPGRTALLMLPPTWGQGGDLDGQPAGEEPTALRLLETALNELADESLHYVQALLAPECSRASGLLEPFGFELLTRLAYLERSPTFPWVDAPPASTVGWIGYGAGTHDTFAATLLSTYQQSSDCPELTGVRPIEDVIASHKAAGAFDPALWEIAVMDDAPAGCLLCARIEPGGLLEIVYMGVVADARRRGVGRLLLRRALQHARQIGARGVTLVVDERNEAALRLYASLGFAQVAQRDAWLQRCDRRSASADRNPAARQFNVRQKNSALTNP